MRQCPICLIAPLMLGAIADDVTGGTDLGSVLRRAGLSVIQTLGVPQTSLPAVDAVVISLKTRTAPVAEAIEHSLAAANCLRSHRATQLYFKYCSTFDSTDKGNIGPVIDALLDRLGTSFTIACPAYPALIRTTYAAHLFVHGELLSESSMRHHPLTPMTDSNLIRVLSRQSRGPVGAVALETVEAGAAAVRGRFDDLNRSGTRVAIVDAVFDRHLDVIGEAALDLPLVTGGAALGGALARAHVRAHPQSLGGVGEAAAWSRPDERVAILSGSCSSATQAQVHALAGAVPARAVDPLSLAGRADEVAGLTEWARERARQGPVLLYSTSRSEQVADVQARLGRGASAALVESAFSRIAETLARDGVRTFVIAGGETSGAVLNALGIRTLEFGDDIEPGVPWTRSLEPPGFTLALKSGNFGGPEFFLNAIGGRR
jgi:3-dehydrotetronate 4-kinase